MNSTQNLFPLMIDLSGRKIIIIGAGKVAERKAALFIDYADVTVVNSYFGTKLKQLEGVGQLSLTYTNPETLADAEVIEIVSSAFMVIPATNDLLLNSRIAKLAKSCGALINEVDAVGEVIVPSVIHQGDVMIGISTNGTSPALSKYMRKKLEQIITPQYAEMARLQAEMREYYKQHIPSQSKRKKLLWELLNNEDLWLALSESYEKAIKIAHKM